MGAAALAPADVRLGKIQVSMHAYGSIHGWVSFGSGATATCYWFGPNYNTDGSGLREDLNFGRYGEITAGLDSVASDAPYYLRVQSAGNDRTDGYTGLKDGTGHFTYLSPAGDYMDAVYTTDLAPCNDAFDNGGYDTIIAEAAAKNVLAVGAVNDAVTAGQRDPAAGAMTSFSGWGPTDDGRIKPDLVANGYKVRVPSATGNMNYTQGTGTSFSAPSVAGVVALLI